MGWRSKCLSQASRSNLIKSVAQAIPNYIMYSLSMLNKVFCDKLDALCRRFWLKSKEPEGKILAQRIEIIGKTKVSHKLDVLSRTRRFWWKNKEPDGRFLAFENRDYGKNCVIPNAQEVQALEKLKVSITLLAKLAWMIASKRESFFFFFFFD